MKIIYDLEIVRAIPPKDGKLQLGVQYCEGWSDHAGMGIAVICTIDTKGNPRVFGAESLDKFQELVNWSEQLISYNGISFDNKVLEANGVIIPHAKCLDLLLVLQAETGRRYKLDDLARRNFNAGKTADGALAPVMWQQGKHIEVIDYCLNDVAMTRKLWWKMFHQGEVICPYSGQVITVNKERMNATTQAA